MFIHCLSPALQANEYSVLMSNVFTKKARIKSIEPLYSLLSYHMICCELFWVQNK